MTPQSRNILIGSVAALSVGGVATWALTRKGTLHEGSSERANAQILRGEVVPAVNGRPISGGALAVSQADREATTLSWHGRTFSVESADAAFLFYEITHSWQLLLNRAMTAFAKALSPTRVQAARTAYVRTGHYDLGALDPLQRAAGVLMVNCAFQLGTAFRLLGRFFLAHHWPASMRPDRAIRDGYRLDRPDFRGSLNPMAQQAASGPVNRLILVDRPSLWTTIGAEIVASFTAAYPVFAALATADRQRLEADLAAEPHRAQQLDAGHATMSGVEDWLPAVLTGVLVVALCALGASPIAIVGAGIAVGLAVSIPLAFRAAAHLLGDQTELVDAETQAIERYVDCSLDMTLPAAEREQCRQMASEYMSRLQSLCQGLGCAFRDPLKLAIIVGATGAGGYVGWRLFREGGPGRKLLGRTKRKLLEHRA